MVLPSGYLCPVFTGGGGDMGASCAGARSDVLYLRHERTMGVVSHTRTAAVPGGGGGVSHARLCAQKNTRAHAKP